MSTATATTGPATALTLEALHRAEKLLESLAPKAPPALRVIESQFATRGTPARKHKKRRHQSEAYHNRIQKKWTKRFGIKQEPCAYVIDASLLSLSPFGRRGKTLVVHPSLMTSLRAGTLDVARL